MTYKKWFIKFMVIFLLTLTLTCLSVIWTDPFFHYHGPKPYFQYQMDNQRSINDGITRNFEYDAIISGTSMTENFKTSEADAIFDKHFIKVPFSGGRFKEINDNIRVGIQTHPEVSCVIRSLDQYAIDMDKDSRRDDLGEYPAYLYDDCYWNDVKYVLNKDIIFNRALPMLKAWLQGQEGQIPSFDTYSFWENYYSFGPEYVLADSTSFSLDMEQREGLLDESVIRIKENIQQNVTSLAAEYPDVTFYFFLPPYSSVYWARLWESGSVLEHIEIQKVAIEEMLKYPNIQLFSFDTNVDLVTNLSNYKDLEHYNSVTNTWILEQMQAGNGLLTKDNYMDYLAELTDFYLNFDFNILYQQLPS